jgi:hypothetical protein
MIEADQEINAGPETGTTMTYLKLLDVRPHIRDNPSSSVETTRAGLTRGSSMCRNAVGVVASIC